MRLSLSPRRRLIRRSPLAAIDTIAKKHNPNYDYG
jgi:hypothetical protein